MANLDGTDDVFDSRDVIERLEEIEDEMVEAEDEARFDDVEDLAQEREILESLRNEFDHREFEDGVILISDDYFVDYAQELAEDIGAYDPDAGWPNAYIDWERAADDLRMDYSAVEFHGVTYWGRA